MKAGRGQVRWLRRGGPGEETLDEVSLLLTLEILSALLSSELVPENHLNHAHIDTHTEGTSACVASIHRAQTRRGPSSTCGRNRTKLTSEGCRPITNRLTARFSSSPAKINTKLVPSPFCPAQRSYRQHTRQDDGIQLSLVGLTSAS